MKVAGRRVRSILVVVTAGVLACGPAPSRHPEAAGPTAACFDADPPYPLDPPALKLAADGVRTDHLQAWVELLASPRTGGRRAGTGDTGPVGASIAQSLQQTGLEPGDGASFCRSFDVQGFSEHNVVARSSSEPRLLVVAHYDGQGRRPTGEPLPGADDNASGVAVLLEFARLAAREPSEAPVAVAALTAEEIGRLGATRFLADPPFDTASVEVVVVLDMVGRPQEGLGYGWTGAAPGPELDSAVQAAAARAGVDLLPLSAFGDRRPGDTDADVFGTALPTVLLSTGLHDDYHGPGDLPDRLDMGFLGRMVEMLLHLRRGLGRESAVQSGP